MEQLYVSAVEATRVGILDGGSMLRSATISSTAGLGEYHRSPNLDFKIHECAHLWVKFRSEMEVEVTSEAREE